MTLIDQLSPVGGSRALSTRRSVLVQFQKEPPGFGYHLQGGAPAGLAR
ncbi:hypothetical protein ABN034_22185 [Actinopolymorpha sp. B11F2]